MRAALATLAVVSAASLPRLNVLGGPLTLCSLDPLTGYRRDGYCSPVTSDGSSHTVAARVTEEFLRFSLARSNDLVTPSFGFPGLKPGDRWCLCARRWREALEAGVAPPVDLNATSIAALHYVPLEALLRHALPVPALPGGRRRRMARQPPLNQRLGERP